MQQTTSPAVSAPELAPSSLQLSRSGEVTLQGELAGLINPLLQNAERGTEVRLQLHRGRDTFLPPAQLELTVTSFPDKPLGLKLARPIADQQLALAAFSGEVLTASRVMRDGLAEDASHNGGAAFNPMVTVWSRIPEFQYGWDALNSLVGKPARVEFTWENAPSSAQGYLSIFHDTATGKPRYRFTPSPDTSLTERHPIIIPDPSLILTRVQSMAHGSRWTRELHGGDALSEIADLQSRFFEDCPVRVLIAVRGDLDPESETKPPLEIVGRWRGIDDRYLPLIVLDAMTARDGTASSRLKAARLSDVVLIESISPAPGEFGIRRTEWGNH